MRRQGCATTIVAVARFVRFLPLLPLCLLLLLVLLLLLLGGLLRCRMRCVFLRGG